MGNTSQFLRNLHHIQKYFCFNTGKLEFFRPKTAAKGAAVRLGSQLSLYQLIHQQSNMSDLVIDNQV